MATVRIQLRRGTSSQWDTANPTLAAGEIGIETDTNTFKFGDGTTAWNDLSYALSDTVDDYILLSQKGAANGVATLDGTGKVPYAQIPSIDELSQDAVNEALVAGTGITKTYNDGSNTITVAVDTSVIATKAELAEVSQDSINDALVAGTGLEKTYDDVNNLITIDIDSTVATLTGSQTLTNKTLTSPVINTPTGIVKSDVGLANVDNTSDADKPVSTATQSALDLKAPLASPALTGTPTAPTAASNTNDTQIATTAFAKTVANTAQSNAESYTDSQITALVSAAPSALNTLNELAAALGDDANFASTVTTALGTKAPIDSPTFTGTVSLPAITGIGNVNSNEISYLDGVTSSIQIQLDDKAPLASPTLTGTVTLPQSTSIGDVTSNEISYLGGVSSSIQGQIDDKLDSSLAASTYAPLASPTLTGTVTLPSTTSIGDVTSNEISYLGGVSSSIQGQIDDKLDSSLAASTYAPLASPTLTGTVTLPSTTSIGNVTATEIAYLSGTTSSVQIQLDDKAPLASPTLTGTVTLPSTTSIGDVTATEIAYLNGTTSSVQIQLDDKAPLESPVFTGTVGLPSTTSIGDVSATELAYLNGVTSGIQTQLDDKAPLASPTFTGTVTLPDNTVTGAMIADTTIPTGKISDTAITAAKLAASAVETAKINNLAVTTEKIADSAVTSAKIANDTIVNADINSAAAIDWSKLAISSTVDSTEIGYVNGVTSAIQTQIDSKAAASTVSSHNSATTSVHGISDTAQLAYLNAANQTFTGNMEVDGNMTVDGNLTVNGTTFNASATSITIEDNMVQLAHQNSSNSVDLGLVVAYTDGTAKHAGIVRDVSDSKWKLFKDVADEPATTVNFGQGSLDNLAVNNVEVSGVVFSDGTQTKEGVPSRTTVDSKTADYTLVLTDRDKMIEVNSSSALTVSIPTDASVNFPIGTSIDLLRVGSGAVTISAATPATTTLNYTPGNKLRAQWSSATLFKRAANTWVLMGDLTA